MSSVPSDGDENFAQIIGISFFYCICIEELSKKSVLISNWHCQRASRGIKNTGDSRANIR